MPEVEKLDAGKPTGRECYDCISHIKRHSPKFSALKTADKTGLEQHLGTDKTQKEFDYGLTVDLHTKISEAGRPQSRVKRVS